MNRVRSKTQLRPLALERDFIIFMPLRWVVVHPTLRAVHSAGTESVTSADPGVSSSSTDIASFSRRASIGCALTPLFVSQIWTHPRTPA